MKQFDIAILGGGPGGYVAAIKASQLGAKVALIEVDKLGGVCLNVGCIPTKTLLRSAKLYQDLLASASFGIDIPDIADVTINWENLMNRKDSVVKKMVSGVQQLMKYNGIEVMNGFGTAIDAHTIEVNGEKISAKNLILATGSSVKLPEIEGIEEGYKNGVVIDSTGAIALKKHPKSITILGGGVIAVEFATLFNSLGTKVTMLQRSDVILKNLDEDVRNTIQRHLITEGVEILTNTTLKSISGQTTYYELEGEVKTVTSDFILASLGRAPNLKGIENLKLKVGRKGVEVDRHMETNVKGIYAIGDMVGKMMLAHVASAEGIVAAEAIMGTKTEIDYNKVPACIYSFPEVGVIGYSEEEAKKAGFDVGTSLFPLSANGKAMAEGETTGFVKIVHDKKYGEVLGVHIVASHATDMIAEAAVSLELEGTIYDLAKTVHPHPTLSEIVMEAAHGAVDKPIHIIKK
ncbi:dihydrolipoyl dehydrogenase [Fusibacter sp. 3D3]|uniref:dihydrolipoyl dehydrogenase n=1 Tax=Fusibacter sp. 3D3 TaxID=1048380 RepID=UPI000852EBAF|nr:dihydrolipoyl dehydrogenase [Fusibacter sp. 3D3]GAU77265.1 dihydrolipoamide dehydrogenase of pyruvate dehydrogenase complex [Fusibacter sp. 3D3]